MRLVVLSCLVAVGILAAAACSDDPSPKAEAAPLVDASGSDVVFGDDSSATEASAPKPEVGDVCGDVSGLQVKAPWAMRGGCGTRAGHSDSEGPTDGKVSATALAHVADSSPAVGLDWTWLGTVEGDILAIDRLGEVRFGLRTGGPIRSSAAIGAAGGAIIGSEDGFLYSVESGNGLSFDDAGGFKEARTLFALEIGPTDSSPAIGADGTIYIGINAGKLVAVDALGTKVTWTFDSGDTSGSSPAIGQDGTIYVGSSDAKVHAVTPAGATKWDVALGSPIDGSVAVGGDGTIYAVSKDKRLHAIAPEGTERWAVDVGGNIHGAPAVYAGTVYVGSSDRRLHAIATADGKEKWTYLTLGEVATPVTVKDGSILVGSGDGRLYAVTAGGRLLFSVGLKGKVTSAPAVGDIAAYIATETGLAIVSP